MYDDMGDLELIKIKGPDYGHFGGPGEAVFTYGSDGAVAVW